MVSAGLYFVLIGFLAGMFIYFRKDTPLYLRLFTWFLFLTIIVETIASVLSERKIYNILLYNIFTSFEFIFYFWVLRQVITGETVRKILSYCLLLYPLLSLAEIIIRLKANGFHAITYSLGCLLIVALCIYYFIELFQRPHAANLFSESTFWICSGLLFYYSCSFPFFALSNYLTNVQNIIVRNLSFILNMMNILLYSSFTIAFLCRIRTRRSI
jgi:hypothetical protein